MKQTAFKKIVFALLGTAAFWTAYIPVRDLLRDNPRTDYYSHIPLIPIVSIFLILRHRKEIFGKTNSLYLPGLLMMAAGPVLYLAGGSGAADLNDFASAAALSALLFGAGAFLLLFGRVAFRKAFFPFAFLLFAVPIPLVVMEKVISILVIASTAVTRFFFEAIGVPFIQEGAVFHLPDLSIEVAQQCSGIRSSLALLITTVLAGHLFLKKFRSQAILVLAVFPVAVFKNGVRIVTLYLLSYFVDMGIIEGGFLHKSGGFIFFGLGLVILGGGLLALRKLERSP